MPREAGYVARRCNSIQLRARCCYSSGAFICASEACLAPEDVPVKSTVIERGLLQ